MVRRYVVVPLLFAACETWRRSFPMKLPPKKSTLFLAMFLIGYGSLIVLELDKNGTLQAITAILAIAAGVFVWLDR